MVATHTLGERAGVVSGCALLVDYMLTITVSVASCVDAIFSFLPMGLHQFKLAFGIFLIILLIILNLRGVKESVSLLAPIFVTFVLTHAFMLGYGILTHVDDVGPIAGQFQGNLHQGISTLGGLGLLFFSFMPTLSEVEPTPGLRRSRTGSRS